MVPTHIFDRSVRVRPEITDVEEGYSDSENGSEFDRPDHNNRGGSSDEGQDLLSEESDKEEIDIPSDDSEEKEASLEDISFGALAKAQDSIAPPLRKRKATDPTDGLPERDDGSTTRDVAQRYHDGSSRDSKRPRISRTSKHAPIVQSSRYAVSRRREIFEPSPSLKSRDPRFDPTVTSSSSTNPTIAIESANKNYAFLTSYQASEVLDLKSQIKKARDPETIASLKRQLMSLESKLRRSEAQQREKDIKKRHKDQERQAIASGQKKQPYFLKKSTVKKEAIAERFESMGKKARDKAVERKRKRIKGKEGRSMPMARRGQNSYITENNG